MVHLARTVYEGANHTHLSELLSEREGLDMGRTTLRRILVNAGLSSPRRRRPPKHRVRRQRMPREGMLIQMDGSYHRWLGEDGPQFTILFAVDDATGCVVNALFCDHEDTLTAGFWAGRRPAAAEPFQQTPLSRAGPQGSPAGETAWRPPLPMS